jgi:hypothetical protein
MQLKISLITSGLFSNTSSRPAITKQGQGVGQSAIRLKIPLSTNGLSHKTFPHKVISSSRGQASTAPSMVLMISNLRLSVFQP